MEKTKIAFLEKKKEKKEKTLGDTVKDLENIVRIIGSLIMIMWMVFSVVYATGLIASCQLCELTSNIKLASFLLFPFFYHPIHGLLLKIQEIHIFGTRIKTKDVPIQPEGVVDKEI